MASTVHKKGRRSRLQSSLQRHFSTTIASCGVNGSDRTVERRSAGNEETMQQLMPLNDGPVNDFGHFFFYLVIVTR